MISTSVVVLSFAFVVALAQDDGTIVQLEKGKIRGIIRQSENGKNYYSFQEIPYAAPPLGSNRYKLPQEPEAWDGVLNTTKNTKICYQKISRHDYLNITEDCLYINVYTPVKPGDNDSLPVLLWIHGGGFVNESGIYEYYGPKYIMDQGVVVVSFNYRLGSFGFVGTEDGVIPLNLGLKDQRFAIEWVNKNIYLFGGNPNQVTLVGESAGSLSVGLHLISQRPKENLFHAVIMQSGSPIAPLLKQNEPTINAFKLGKAINEAFSSKNSTDLLTLLQNADAEDILNSNVDGGISLENEGLFSFPVFQAFIDKKFKQVPVLIGFNSEEWLFLVLSENKTFMAEIDADPTLLLLPRINFSPENRIKAGASYKEIYVGNGSFVDDYGAYIKYVSDSLFVTGTCKQVEISSQVSPYYLYQFAYKGELGEQMNLIPPKGCGSVVHAEDLHYMWDDTTNSDLSQFPAEDGLMLHRYVRMWTNFVKYFDPTPEADPLLDNFRWPTSEPNTLRYLNINSTFEMRILPRKYTQINDVLETYMEPPYDSFA